MTQPWGISATLRGFYDDNYSTVADHPTSTNSVSKRGSFGFQVSPSGSVALATDQTDVAARYTFGAYWYADRDRRGLDPFDYTHQFDGYLSHTFSQRYNVYVTDSFVMAQEAQLIDPFNSLPYRTQGNNLRNTGSITFNAQLTQLLTLVLGYSNTYYDYKQDQEDVTGPNNPFGVGSYSALLDRVEHLILVNLQWQLSPQTVGVLGYQFGLIGYTADEFMSGQTVFTTVITPSGPVLVPVLVNPLKSDFRNSYIHSGSAGIDHTFNPDFTVSLRAGAQYADSYNDPSGYNNFGPYGNLNLRYRYGAGSYIDATFQQQFSQTDVLAYNASVSSVYASINHALTPQLTGSVIGQFQYSQYNSQAVPGLPDYNGQSYNYYLVGLNLAYHFNRHVSADVGYNFDMLDSSSAARYNFTRNRVYVGVTAAY